MGGGEIGQRDRAKNTYFWAKNSHSLGIKAVSERGKYGSHLNPEIHDVKKARN